MNDDLKKLGELFQAKRQENNLSLKEVENSTSIRASYLEAIEHGKTENTLSSVYVTGFIRQYATFLGLDVDKIVKDFPTIFDSPAQKHDFSYGIGTLEMRGSMGGGVKWLPNLVWAGITAVILAAAWYLSKYLGIF